MKYSILQKFRSVAIVGAVSLPLFSCANSPSFIVVHESSQNSVQNLVHGKLVVEDSNRPVSGATVYVPKNVVDNKKPLADLSLSSAIEQTMGCKTPAEPYTSFTCTDDLGNFSIPVTNNSVLKLKFQNGKTITSTNLSLDDIGSDIGTIAFTKQAGPEQKKKIAIVLNMENVSLTYSEGGFLPQNLKVEFEQEFAKIYEIDENQYDVEFMPFTALFEDKDKDKHMDIFNYAMVYLITPGDENLSDIGKEQKLTLLDFISKGGELFVTTLNAENGEPTLKSYI